ncbi:hypothetical protein KP509_21G024000 [Ceratopteris richardii]|uniref:GST C-terminal domain-containing protein n=1 Tax=Ceratopteris richardii TaxID=49495 RepID=A0A8T2SAZ2_CERRI|nr:hypothetical protein KP509_21G024000 [Ceratopteris richardii]
MPDDHQLVSYAVGMVGLIESIKCSEQQASGYSEHHAILRYLSSAYPDVADHWYPADVKKRAQIDCILDWHHTNLRPGSGGLTINRVAAPLLGRPLDEKTAAESEVLLKASIKRIDTLWLNKEGSFLTGNEQPSIADLSLACELMQVEFLGEEYKSELLSPHPKVKHWLKAGDVHQKLKAGALAFRK